MIGHENPSSFVYYGYEHENLVLNIDNIFLQNMSIPIYNL
jgi:hypothetical protein